MRSAANAEFANVIPDRNLMNPITGLFTYQFGAFKLDSKDTLTSFGRAIRLPPKEIGMLRCLVEAAGDRVSKDDFVRMVWNGEPISDDSVSRCLYSLRKTLREAVNEPCIETIHRRGYRLQVPVIRLDLEKAPSLPRLAVLPFSRHARQQGNDYILDMLPAALIGQLTRLHRDSMTVITRATVLQYDGGQGDFERAAQELGLEYIVTGDIHSDADNHVVHVELLDMHYQEALWSETFMFLRTAQEDFPPDAARLIARRISIPPKSTALSVEPRRGPKPDAYAAFLSARHLFDKRGATALKEAMHLFQRTLELDPRFARAHAGLADCYLFLGFCGALWPREAAAKARIEIDLAFALDPDLANAHASRGFLASAFEFDQKLAARCYQRALQDLPDDAEVHSMYARHLLCRGQPGAAVTALRAALQTNSQSIHLNMYLAMALCRARQNDDAMEQARRAIQIVPSYSLASAFLGGIAAASGTIEQAREGLVSARQAYAAAPDVPGVLWALADVLARVGEFDEARRLVDSQRAIMHQEFCMPALAIPVLAQLDDPDGACQMLLLGEQQGDPWIPLILTDPCMDKLYRHDNFAALAKRMSERYN